MSAQRENMSDPTTAASSTASMRQLRLDLAQRGGRVRVRGDCMKPMIADGDILQLADGGPIWPGDVLVFVSRSGQLTVHRLLGVYLRQRQWHFLCKGDRRDAHDGGVRLQQVLGPVRRVNGKPFSVSLLRRLHSLLIFARCCLRRLLTGAASPRTT